MDIQNPEKIEIEDLKTIHKLCKFGANHNMEGCSFTEIVERMFDELSKAQAIPEGFVLLPSEPSEAIKVALSYQCFDFIKVAQIYRECGFDIPKKAEDEQSFFLHKFLLLAIKHGGDFIKAFNAETKAMIEAQEQG